MTDETELGWRPELTHFKNESESLFNTRPYLINRSIKIVETIYGKDKVQKELLPLIEHGVMGVFAKLPNEVTILFVYVLSKMTDDYHIRREKREKSLITPKKKKMSSWFK